MTNKRVHELDLQVGLNAGDVLVVDNEALGAAVKLAVTEFLTTSDLDTLAKLNAIVSDATLFDDNLENEAAVRKAGAWVEGVTLAQADSYYASSDRTITAGTGLDGGGSLAADRTIDLADTAVTPGTYGSATNVPQVTIDQQGRVTLAADVAISAGTAIMADTKDNIIASTPTEDTLGFATDALRFYLWINDDSAWYESPINFARNSGVDMGYEKDSSKAGYGLTYITDKNIANCLIGSNSRNEERAIRVNKSNSPPTFEIYLDGSWRTIIYDFTVASGDLRHTPFSADEEIYVWRGDSVAVGLNGQPLVSEYSRDMGAFPSPRRLCGGSF